MALTYDLIANSMRIVLHLPTKYFHGENLYKKGLQEMNSVHFIVAMPMATKGTKWRQDQLFFFNFFHQKLSLKHNKYNKDAKVYGILQLNPCNTMLVCQSIIFSILQFSLFFAFFY